MIFYFKLYSRIVAEVELELFQYVNLLLLVLKLGRDVPIFISGSYFPSDLKQKCIGLWGFLHHLCHPCLL